MSNKSIPTKDRDLLKFAINGKGTLVADGASYGFIADDVNALVSAVDEYESSYQEHRELSTQARAARQKKDSARKKLKKILGEYIRRMRSRRDVSSAKLVAFGIKPTDRIKTPINAPETVPQFNIEYAPAWHIMRFWEEGSARRRRRKPKGVIGAEIYVNFDGERDDLENYRLKTLAVGLGAYLLSNIILILAEPIHRLGASRGCGGR